MPAPVEQRRQMVSDVSNATTNGTTQCVRYDPSSHRIEQSSTGASSPAVEPCCQRAVLSQTILLIHRRKNTLSEYAKASQWWRSELVNTEHTQNQDTILHYRRIIAIGGSPAVQSREHGIRVISMIRAPQETRGERAPREGNVQSRYNTSSRKVHSYAGT